MYSAIPRALLKLNAISSVIPDKKVPAATTVSAAGQVVGQYARQFHPVVQLGK